MKRIFTLFLLLFLVTTGAKGEKFTASSSTALEGYIENYGTANNPKAGDTIMLAEGIFNISATIEIKADTTLTIIGNGPENTIIDGGWNKKEGAESSGGVRIFDIGTGASVTMEGLTLQRGRVDNSAGVTGQYGGAIRNYGSLVLTNCVLKENRIVGNNTYSKGGAIRNNSGATAILKNCQLMDNRADDIGGAIVSAGALTVINSTLTGNQSGDAGGAINIQGGGTTALLMINTTITGNSSVGNGGGLVVAGGETATILNSIIVGNTADGDGDDIRNANTAIILMAYSAYGELDGIAPATDIANQEVDSAADVLAEDLEPIGVAATGGIATGFRDGAAYYSTDNGANWTPVAGGAGITNAIPLTSTNNKAMGSTFRLAIEPGVHYLLSFTVDEGIRINPAHLAYHIEEGHDYTFYMYMQEGFAHKKPYVTLNGQPVKIRQTQDGTGWVYRIPAVYEDQDIEIVLQDLTDNLNPDEAGVVIYSSAGALIVEAAEPMAVTIYNITGQAVAQERVDSRAAFNLPKGIYIVRADGKAVKAVVR